MRVRVEKVDVLFWTKSISDSTLRLLLPPQLKQMSAQYKVMCGCECCIYSKHIHASLLSWRYRYFKAKMFKTEGLEKKKICIYETYKNIVMPHGCHIYAKASDMAQDTMCAYPQSNNALPHWKFVFRWCANCSCVNLPDQETDDQYSYTTHSIRFHIYHIIARCTDHGIIPLKDKKICRKCKQ